VSGDLHFRVRGPAHELIEDTYAVRIRLPQHFPRDLPTAWETVGRIPNDSHKMDDGSLCLGAPTE